MKTCRISLNYSDFEEGKYLFVPYTYDIEKYKFIDHWDEAVEGANIPDGMQCVGFVGDADMYGDKGHELMESGRLKIGIAIMQDENGELYVE